MQQGDKAGIDMPAGERKSLSRLIFPLALLVLSFSLVSFSRASIAQTPPATTGTCPPGVVDLSSAVSVGQWALHVNDYYNYDRACNTVTKQFPGGMPGAPVAGPPNRTGYCANYDCSSLSTWIARQIPGFKDKAPIPNGPGITITWYGCTMGPPTTGLTPCDPAKNPVCWAFASFGGSGNLNGCPNGPQHMYSRICNSLIFNAAGNKSTPQIKDTAGNKDSRWFVPPGLEVLTMASCDPACLNGVPVAPGAGGGACGTTTTTTTPTTPTTPTTVQGSGGQEYAPGAFITYGGVPGSGGKGTGGPETPVCTEFYEQEGYLESGNNYQSKSYGVTCGCFGRFQHCAKYALKTSCQNQFGIAPPPPPATCATSACINTWLATPNAQDLEQRAKYKSAWDTVLNDSGMSPHINEVRVSTNKHITFILSQSAILSGYNYLPSKVEAYIQSGKDDCSAASGNGGMCLSDYMAKNSFSVIIDDPWGIDNPGCHDLKKVDGSPSGGSSGGGGGGCPAPPPCGNPVFTGQFAKNPCNIEIPDFLKSLPGSDFLDNLNDWWSKKFLPAIKDMTTQLYSYRVFQTWQIGRMMDAIDVMRASRLEREQRVVSQQEASPNEATCVAGSFPTSLTRTALTSTALTQGIKQDLTRREHSVKKDAPYIDPKISPENDRKTRWDEYCKEFYDPLTNGGSQVCGDGAAPGLIINGDISIEGILLSDTIDMSNPDQYKAAMAIIRNIVRPNVEERVEESLVLTAKGRERLLRQQHLEAILAVTEDVVTSMITRRTAMPPTSTDVGLLISGIREKAGIDPATISKTPSYNEIMEAMTKERFFDPEYFYLMQNNVGAIKQEQASVDAYTSVQLQDIYLMQEQINALLAARAALNLDTDKATNQTPATPLKKTAP